MVMFPLPRFCPGGLMDCKTLLYSALSSHVIKLFLIKITDYCIQGTQVVPLTTVVKTMNVKLISAKILLQSVLRAREVFHFLKCFLAIPTANANMYHFPLCNPTIEKYFKMTLFLGR